VDKPPVALRPHHLIAWLLISCIIVVIVRSFIYSADVTSSPLGRGHYVQPAWSPDSRYLAFTFRGSGNEELWVWDTNAKKASKVSAANRADGYSGCAWYDNQTLYFVEGDGIRKVDINDKLPIRVLGSDEGWDGFTFQASDKLVFAKRWITMESQPNKPNDLYAFNLLDNAINQLTDTPTIDERDPIFSPDGKRLAYIADEMLDPFDITKTIPGLEILETDGTIRHLAISVRNGIQKLAWSPNSEYLLTISNFDAIGEYDPRLYLYRTDGTGTPKKIMTNYDNDGIFGVAWSPDGSKLAITTVGTPGGNALHIIPSYRVGLAEDIYRN
jgi:Tol biopolymer transport system component